MKRLALLAALVAVVAGCHFPQGWHWPRTGTDTVQTWVYFQNDVVGYQGPYVAWLAGELTKHPELAVRMVGTCAAGVNCVRWVTDDRNGALTVVATGNSPHLVGATVYLDDGIGHTESVSVSKGYVWHEGCHALGGGWNKPGYPDIHSLCNPEHRRHHMADISRVYHFDHP